MSRITRPSKGFAIVGALMIGFLPGAAHAKWIKATVSGLLKSGSADGLAAVGGDVSLDFVIQNYTRTSGSTDTTNQWKQTIAKSSHGNVGYHPMSGQSWPSIKRASPIR